MKPQDSNPSGSRFRAQIRHYHRSGAKPESSWDEWVEGRAPAGRAKRRWWKVAAVVLAVVALAAIAVGLAVELAPR